jgi:hypothetical protein
MTLLGLDLNSSRVRGVCGAAGLPRPIALDGAERELPLTISLERRKPEVGQTGVSLCRRLPHMACINFLPHLGTPREWKAGRHRLDASKAMALVLERLKPACAGIRGLAMALPAYLERPQAGQLAALAAKARMPLLGSVTAPVALAWTAHEQHPWRGLAVVVDVDDHAMTCAVVAADEPEAAGQVRTLGERANPQLGLRAWKERLLDGIADRCIRQSRRDLRDSGTAEQALYEQLDAACEASHQGHMVELEIAAEHWFQNLILTPGDLAAFCRPLVKRVLTATETALSTAQAELPPEVVLLSAAAARLPGMAAALHQHSGAGTVVLELSPDAGARAAHELAEHWRSGALPSGHVDVALPLRQPSPTARPVPKSTLRQSNTKIPSRGGAKLNLPDDDFSVTIDED